MAQALSATQSEAQITAQALGQAAQPLHWRRLAVLPTRAGPDAAAQLATYAAKLGPALLPSPLPEIPQIANGTTAQFYDLDYRNVGRLTYAPLRHACDAAWRGLAAVLAGLWAEDAAKTETVMGK